MLLAAAVSHDTFVLSFTPLLLLHWHAMLLQVHKTLGMFDALLTLHTQVRIASALSRLTLLVTEPVQASPQHDQGAVDFSM
jgi:hypothetical protein